METLIADQAIKRFFKALRQGFVGEVLIGEQRVAAVGRNFNRIEQACGWRALQIRRVRMPNPAKIGALMFQFGDSGDQRALGQTLQLRVFNGGSEAPREGEVLLRRELLVREEDHEVVEEGVTNLRWLLQVLVAAKDVAP